MRARRWTYALGLIREWLRALQCIYVWWQVVSVIRLTHFSNGGIVLPCPLSQPIISIDERLCLLFIVRHITEHSRLLNGIAFLSSPRTLWLCLINSLVKQIRRRIAMTCQIQAGWGSLLNKSTMEGNLATKRHSKY